MGTLVQSPFGPIDIDAGEAQGDVSAAIQVLNPALKATDEGGDPLIIFTVAISPENREFWCIDQNGKFLVKKFGQIVSDWRYDAATEKWVDSSGRSLEEDVT